MVVDYKVRSSASAIAKILGIEFGKQKEFKILLEGSDLETTDEEYTVKNKTVEYKAYNTINAIQFAIENLTRPNEETVKVEL